MPDWQPHVRPRLARLKLTPAREAEIIEELSQHLDEHYERLTREGKSPEEALRTAVEELCEPDTLSGHMRALRQARVPPPVPPGAPRTALVRDLVQDLRYAARMLWKHPGFTAAVVLTLALGIGANTAIFSVVNATLLQHLPVEGRDRLVYVYRGTGGVFSYPAYSWLRDGNGVFDGFAAWGGIIASLNAEGAAELVDGVIVTGNFFEVLGVRPGRGRLISPADDLKPGGHPVVVIGHDFWQSRFAAAPDIVGRAIRLNGHPFTIIGVAPAGFNGPRVLDSRNLYVPMMMQAIMRPPRAGYSGEQDPDLLNHKTNSWLFGIGRLKPGRDADQATAELGTLTGSFYETQVGKPLQPPLATAVPVDAGSQGDRQRMVSVALLLGGTVGAVLLIGCANIANLLLARAASRRRELAVRVAIGASRARVIRQLLAESLLLALIGGAAGVGLAWAAVRGFEAAPLPAGAPSLDLSIDGRVLLFSLGLSLATGILFGLAPALQASRRSLVPALKDGAQDERRSARFSLKRSLIVAEVALSMVLLIAAGLFVRSLQAAQRIDPGFDADKLISAPLGINLLRYTTQQGRDFYQRLVERVEALPGVEAATVARVRLLSGNTRVLSLHIEGRESSHERSQSEGGSAATGHTATNANIVGAGFFETIGIPVLLGRAFTTQDDGAHPPVAIVNETIVKMHFEGNSPIGQRISVTGPDGPWREIVGVVRDSKYANLGEGALPLTYLPLAQNHETGMTLYVRAAVTPASLVPAVRREIQALEPNLPVPNIETVSDSVASSLYGRRVGAWLIGVFGGLAVVLAAVGIYGVLSFSTARRTHEIGIRLALGAEARDVFLLVLRDGMLLVTAGIAIGLVGALVAGRSLTTFLYGVTPADSRTLVSTTIILGTVALAACAIPARRAMRVDPIVALRQD
jgi:predicted permease